ncbi:MAG: DUF5667 domain-containing protein [Candidatus Yonathbacteria bacterium]|nr:DUF5667 domain-containing protein [Candidatus Yonathbacteria bacterium]
MIKKTFLTSVLTLALFMSGTVFAQEEQVVLPRAGLTPESTFYFLDRLGESLQEFFTFNKEAKAKLQIEFADERIAEIKILVETKGPETKGIEKAKALLVGNVARAAEIVQEVKSAGKEVSALAKGLDDEFDRQEQLLIQTFQDAQKKLKEDRLAAVRQLIEEAQKLGDAEQVSGLKAQAEELVQSIAALKDVRNEIKESFRSEKRKIEGELDDEDQEEDEQDELNDDKNEELEDEDMEDGSDDSDEDTDTDNDNESVREDAKQNAEAIQRELEKSLENSNLTEAEREALKQAGEKAREEAKQKAEGKNEDAE